MRFESPPDFNKLESVRFRFQNLSASPSSPATGQAYYDTDTDTIWYYSAGASAWVELSTGTGLTQEQVEDFVGGMVSGNTETGISVTYDDPGGKLNFAVDDEYISDLVGAMFSGNTETGITVTYQDADNTIDLVVSIDSTMITDFAEAVSDQVGTMVSGNTETGITVTYDDSDNTLDFVVGVLNSLPAPTGDLSLNSQKITNLANGTAATDAVTLGQLNSVSAGIDWKASVRVATTAAGTLASSFENGDTVDGVTLATGDRILIKDQSAGAENGIYVVAASGAPARATDADASAEVTGGLAVWVNEGTTNADTGWVLTTNDAIVLGTTPLVFTQFSGLGQVTAGNALTKTGNTLDVVAGTGLEISSDTIRIAAAAAGSGLTGGAGSALDVNVGTGLEISSDAVRIAAAAAGSGLTGGAGSALAVGAGTGIVVNADDVAVNRTGTNGAHVPLKYSTTIGDNSTTAIAVTHSLGTRAVIVQCYDAATFEDVLVDVVRTSTSVVTLTFAVAPATNAYVVVVLG